MNYRSLLGQINDYLSGNSNLESEELERRIYESYNEGDIGPTEYDHLIIMLDE